MNFRVLTLLIATISVIPASQAGNSTQTKTEKVLNVLAEPEIRAANLLGFAVCAALWARAQHKHSALAASTYKPRLRRAELTRTLDAIKGNNAEDQRLYDMVSRQLETVEKKMNSITDEQVGFDVQRWLFGSLALAALGAGVAPAWRTKSKRPGAVRSQ